MVTKPSKLLGLVQQALIDSKGQMTPVLRRFLAYSQSAKTINQWKTGTFKNTVFRNQWDPDKSRDKQLSRLRKAKRAFPEKDFPKLSSVAEVKASSDTPRTKAALVLANKDLNENRRQQLVGKIVKLKGLLYRRIQQALIDGKGQMTPALRRFLKDGQSKAQLKSWKMRRNQ